MFESMIIAGIGGFFGTCGRYLTGIAAKKLFGTHYPYGTFVVNVTGCFIIGILFGLCGHNDMNPMVKALLVTGFCGGYTTFSSFSHDTYVMIRKGEWLKAILYVCSSVILGLLMVWLGMECIMDCVDGY